MVKKSLILVTVLFAMPDGAKGQVLEDIVYWQRGVLCSIAPDGTGRYCRPPVRDAITSPSWSPTGERLVASVSVHGDQGILRPDGLWLMDEKGNRLSKLEGSDGCFRPIWSPAGQFIYASVAIAFSSDSVTTNAVVRWRADGTDRTVVPVRGREGEENRFILRSFSPSGKLAALQLHPGPSLSRTGDIVVAEVTPSGFHIIRVFLEGSPSSWLDEDNLLFVSDYQLWKLAVNTGEIQKIGIEGLRLGLLALSPDRKSIAITATVSSDPVSRHQSLWLYSFSDERAVRLTSGIEDLVGSWR